MNHTNVTCTLRWSEKPCQYIGWLAGAYGTPYNNKSDLIVQVSYNAVPSPCLKVLATICENEFMIDLGSCPIKYKKHALDVCGT